MGVRWSGDDFGRRGELGIFFGSVRDLEVEA